MSSGPGPFRTEPTGLGPAHRALVEGLREIVIRSGMKLAAVGAAVRARLGQAPVARPEKRISDLASGTRFPTREELQALVGVCTHGSPREHDRFRRLRAAAGQERRARQRTATQAAQDAATQRAAVARVGDPRDWTRLGVHRPIEELSDGTDLSARAREGHLPTYVLREADRRLLRPVLAAAAAGEPPAMRLIIISGESSAGKSRMAAEAAQAELGTWQLQVPRTTNDLTALAQQRSRAEPTLAWLDEIQELLAQPGAVEALTALWTSETGPMVLLATIRTDAEQALDGTAGWRLLDRADLRITLQRRPRNPAEWQAELDRARALDDPWIREALDKIGENFGIAEWLAAGPQLRRLLERLRTSSDPTKQTAAAIVDAAIDCYRAGYTTALPEPLLRAAHALYLPPTHRPHPDLFPAALQQARQPVAGAVGLLIPHRGWGDRAFDYLLSPAERPDIPAQLWTILLDHLTPATLPAVAQAARTQRPDITRTLAQRQPDSHLFYLLDDIPALQRGADAGNFPAGRELARLLAERGQLDTLARRADDGDQFAASELARVLAERGDLDALTRRADDGDQHAAYQLVRLLAERGDLDTLARRADDGDQDAASELARVLAERGDLDTLARRADDGDQSAAYRLVRLLAERGDLDALARRAGDGNRSAVSHLIGLLIEEKDLNVLARRADDGYQPAANELARVLAERGDRDTLTRRADGGDQDAAVMLASLLAERGDLDALTRRADDGDQLAADQLASLLAARHLYMSLQGDSADIRPADTGYEDVEGEAAD